MDKCQSIRDYLIEHFSMPKPNPEKTFDPRELSVKEHLLHCVSCRRFQADLYRIGARLNDLEAKIVSEIQVPPEAYFESLIHEPGLPKGQTHSSAPTSPQEGMGPKGQTRPLGRDFTEILAFLGTGIVLLSGVGLLLQAGFIIPVGVVFGVISMLLPLIVLIEKPGIKDREVS